MKQSKSVLLEAIVSIMTIALLSLNLFQGVQEIREKKRRKVKGS